MREYFTLGGCCGPKWKYFSLGGCGGSEIRMLAKGSLNGSNRLILDTLLGGTVLYPPAKWLKAKTNWQHHRLLYSLNIFEGVLVLN